MYKKLIKTQTTDTDTRNPITVNIQAAGSLALLNDFPGTPCQKACNKSRENNNKQTVKRSTIHDDLSFQ